MGGEIIIDKSLRIATAERLGDLIVVRMTVRRMLKEARAAGLEVLPADGCDNYDSRGVCKGHDRKEDGNEQADNGSSAEQF